MPTAYTRANVGGAAPIDRRTDRVKQRTDEACFGDRGRPTADRTVVTQGVVRKDAGSAPIPVHRIDADSRAAAAALARGGPTAGGNRLRVGSDLRSPDSRLGDGSAGHDDGGRGRERPDAGAFARVVQRLPASGACSQVDRYDRCSVRRAGGTRPRGGLARRRLRRDRVAIRPTRCAIARLEESVRLVKWMFAAEEPVSFEGTYYRLHEFESLPKTVQRPRPPVLIGGGGKAILSLAGREADIVGVNASLGPGARRASGVVGLTAAAVEEKLGWVWAAAITTGHTPAELEFQVSVLEVHITDSRSEAGRMLDSLSDDLGLRRQTVETSPAVLVGSLERCCELLEERRERFGFSYIKLSSDTAASALLVARLAGR